jgi:hypothetical protein
MFSFIIIPETNTSQILRNDKIIDEKTPWENVEAATTWATLVVEELNAGINTDRFDG